MSACLAVGQHGWPEQARSGAQQVFVPCGRHVSITAVRGLVRAAWLAVRLEHCMHCQRMCALLFQEWCALSLDRAQLTVCRLTSGGVLLLRMSMILARVRLRLARLWRALSEDRTMASQEKEKRRGLSYSGHAWVSGKPQSRDSLSFQKV